MTQLLALDLGTQTGWACGPKGVVTQLPPTYGTQSFALGRFDGGGMRFLRFERWLDEMLYDVGHVVYEEVRRHMGTDAAHVYGGLQAILTKMCEDRGIPYESIPVATIKKFATGKGNANKDLMIAAMRGRGYFPEDDNAADALALWLLTSTHSR